MSSYTKHLILTEISQAIPTLKQALEMPSVELRAAIIANTKDYQQLLNTLAVYMQHCYRMSEDAKYCLEELEPIFERLDLTMLQAVNDCDIRAI